MTRRERCEELYYRWMNLPRAFDEAEEHEQCVNLIESFLATLTSTWTPTPPKEPGHYWFRRRSNDPETYVEAYVVYVDKEGSGPLLEDGEWGDRPIAGPVERGE